MIFYLLRSKNYNLINNNRYIFDDVAVSFTKYLYQTKKKLAVFVKLAKFDNNTVFCDK